MNTITLSNNKFTTIYNTDGTVTIALEDNCGFTVNVNNIHTANSNSISASPPPLLEVKTACSFCLEDIPIGEEIIPCNCPFIKVHANCIPRLEKCGRCDEFYGTLTTPTTTRLPLIVSEICIATLPTNRLCLAKSLEYSCYCSLHHNVYCR